MPQTTFKCCLLSWTTIFFFTYKKLVIDDYFTFLFNLFLFKKSYLPLVDLYAFLFYFILFYKHYKLVGLYAYVRGLSFSISDEST